MDEVHGIFSVLNFRDGGVGKEEERGKRVANAAKDANVQHLSIHRWEGQIVHSVYHISRASGRWKSTSEISGYA